MKRQEVVVVASICSLALGIAAVVSIFSLFDALVLRPVAVAHPERLVAMVSQREHGLNTGFPYPDYKVISTATADAVDLVAYSVFPTTVEIGSGPERSSERLFVELVSHDYFRALEVTPQRGRFFDESSLEQGERVGVASFAFWLQRLDGDPDAVGRTLQISGQPMTLIGIAPPDFRGLDGNIAPSLWLPIEHQSVIADREDYLQSLDTSWLYWAGVLREGVSLEAAEQRLETVTLAHWAEIGRDWELGIELHETPTGFPVPLLDYRPYVKLSMAVVSLVLLIACANVAGLLLAAGSGRAVEIAARQCLGAGRWRLARQLLTESLTLGLLAGATGLVLAHFLIRALVSQEPLASRLSGIAVGIDLRVLGLALLATVATYGAVRAGAGAAAGAARPGGGAARHGRDRRARASARTARPGGRPAGDVVRSPGAGRPVRGQPVGAAADRPRNRARPHAAGVGRPAGRRL